MSALFAETARRYIDVARLGRTDWLSGFKGLAWIIAYGIVGNVVGLFIAVIAARSYGFDFTGPTGHLISGGLMTFGFIAGVHHAVVRTQRRPFWSLMGARPTLKPSRVAAGISIALIANVVVTEAMAAENGDGIEWFDWPLSRPYLLFGTVSGMLIIFQAGSEELMFRGWLTQWLGQHLRSRVVLVSTVAALFAVCHGFKYGPLALPYFMLGSLEFSILSLRDGWLDLAIGAHIAHNWLIIALPTTGELPSLYTGQEGLIDLSDLVGAAAELMIVCGTVELLRRSGWLSPSAA